MKIFLLTVEGVAEPWQRLISVEDSGYELIGLIRALALRELINGFTGDEDNQADTLRDLRVSLRDTGLRQYPNTEEELRAVLERMK